MSGSGRVGNERWRPVGPRQSRRRVYQRRPAATAQLVPVLLQTTGLVTTDHSSTLGQRPKTTVPAAEPPATRQIRRLAAAGKLASSSTPLSVECGRVASLRVR